VRPRVARRHSDRELGWPSGDERSCAPALGRAVERRLLRQSRARGCNGDRAVKGHRGPRAAPVRGSPARRAPRHQRPLAEILLIRGEVHARVPRGPGKSAIRRRCSLREWSGARRRRERCRLKPTVAGGSWPPGRSCGAATMSLVLLVARREARVRWPTDAEAVVATVAALRHTCRYSAHAGLAPDAVPRLWSAA
jgi:hypothetical protein